jgi:hypothetical protein
MEPVGPGRAEEVRDVIDFEALNLWALPKARPRSGDTELHLKHWRRILRCD